MSQNRSENNSHPEELLEGYALDALTEEESSLVQAHLELCSQCQGTVARLQQTTALLGLSVVQQAPPIHLGIQIMASLPSAEVDSLTLQSPSAKRTRGINASAWALPLAAAVVIGLFSVSLIMNLHVSGRVDQLTQENSTVTAQLGQTTAQTQRLAQQNSALSARLDQAEVHDAELVGTMRQMQVASFMSVYSDTQPLILEPPSGSGNSEGVLLVADRGHRAVLMVSNMEQPPPLRTYNLWLARKGNRILLGQVQVDASGWGTLSLTPPEPVFMFDWVNLTVDEREGITTNPGEMVLRSKIPTADYAR